MIVLDKCDFCNIKFNEIEKEINLSKQKTGFLLHHCEQEKEFYNDPKIMLNILIKNDNTHE